MAQNNWEADKMLDVYIYDYLLKRNLQNSAKAFMAEGKVAVDPVAIDAPGGFLFEWWSVFWDIFIARTNEKHSEVAAAYIEAQQMKAREHQQQMQMQQLQIMQQRQAQLQRRDAGHPSFTGSINGMGSESLLGQSTASVLAAKMYEERMKHPNSMDPESSSQLDASRMALLKSSTNQSQLVQGTPGTVSATLQQIQAQTQQTPDIKGDPNLIASQRPLPMDASIYAPRLLHSKAGLGSPGLNEGASGLPLKGWPLTGLDQLRPNLAQQVQKSFIQTPNQFQLLTAQQQHQLLAQAQVHGNIGPAGSANFSDMDPRRFRMSQRSGLNGKDGHSTNEGSIGSSIGSPKVRASSQDQAELLMKMNMDQMQNSSAQQQQPGQLQPQQLQQNNRKRKQHSSSGAVNSTGTGNTAGPSPTSAPSTPSTHTPGDGLPMASMHVNGISKSMIICGADGPGGLASSSNQLEDMEHFGDGCLEDNVESFLSPHDDADPSLFGTLKRSSMDHSADSSKGFTFLEFGCLRSSTSKVVCCHFSSDGKLLASAGHEKKVVLWNMDTLKPESTPEEHGHLITDVRFKPGSSHLATSSFDRTVRLWNAADPNYCLHAYTGHGSPVMSLDFHPKKTDILCSCDGNGEIRLWSSNQFSCTRVSKGATAQVRFQPRVGQLLAAAAENVVSIFDFESDRKMHALQGHTKEVHSVCWDANGDYLASVSEDSVRVWSLASGGECIHELSSNGNKFHSCVFHPAYPTLLVIGGYQSLELWNMVDNKTMTVAAHEGLIAALAQSPATGMVASASHDKCVKIWK